MASLATDEELSERSRDVLFVQAWAYFIALSQGNAAGARGLLRAFQETYNAYQQWATAGMVGDTSVIPQTVPETGTFDARTRIALMIALINGESSIAPQQAETLPLAAAGIPTWFEMFRTPYVGTPGDEAATAFASYTDPDTAYGIAVDSALEQIEGWTSEESAFPAVDEYLGSKLITGTRSQYKAQWPVILFMAAIGIGVAGVGWTAYNKKRRRRR